MVVQIQDYAKKKLPNEAQQKFIDLARYIRQREYSKVNGNSEALAPHYQGFLKSLETSIREDGEEGFDKAWDALSVDDERLKEWKKLVTEVAPDEDKLQERPYQLHRFSYFKNRPRKQWLVKDMVTDRGSVLICGTGGDGKSTLILDMYLSCIFDIPFLDKEKHPETKPVFLIWVAAESQDELFPRAYAWAISHGVTEEELEEHALLLDTPVPLNAPDETARFIQSTNEQLTEIGVSHETHTIVVVFDTYSKCTPGADENSTKEVKIIVQMVDLVRTEMHAQVTIICHTNAEGIVKGNKALRDGVDIVWIVSKNDDTICLTNDKMRGAPPPEKIYACMKSIILDVNEPGVTEPVIFALDEKVGSIRFTPNAQKQILAILAENGPTNATKLQEICLEKHNIKRATFYTHINNLGKNGSVAKLPENAPKGAKVEYSITDTGAELLESSLK